MDRPLELDMMSVSGGTNRSLSPNQIIAMESARTESSVGTDASDPDRDHASEKDNAKLSDPNGQPSSTADALNRQLDTTTDNSAQFAIAIQKETDAQSSAPVAKYAIFVVVYAFAFLLLTSAMTTTVNYFFRPFHLFAMPPFNTPAILFVSYQIMIIIVIYWWQRYEPSPYNKFWSEKSDGNASLMARVHEHTLPTRFGMSFLYFIPSASALALFVCQLSIPSMGSSTINCIPSLLVAIKFGKRVLECLFVHRFSGRMPTALVLSFPLLYTLFTFVPCIYVGKSVPIHGLYPSVRFGVGIMIFCIGEMGNGFYHWRLRQLRKVRKNESTPPNSGSAMNQIQIVTKGVRRYVVPKGGLFDYVVAPHYLFEIISFVGIAVATFHLNWILSLLIFISNLCGRGKAALKWYRKKFGSFPKNRKALIPFIY